MQRGIDAIPIEYAYAGYEFRCIHRGIERSALNLPVFLYMFAIHIYIYVSSRHHRPIYLFIKLVIPRILSSGRKKKKKKKKSGDTR